MLNTAASCPSPLRRSRNRKSRGRRDEWCGGCIGMRWVIRPNSHWKGAGTTDSGNAAGGENKYLQHVEARFEERRWLSDGNAVGAATHAHARL